MLSSNLKASNLENNVRSEKSEEWCSYNIIPPKELFLNKMERNNTEWEKIFVNYLCGKANICAG